MALPRGSSFYYCRFYNREERSYRFLVAVVDDSLNIIEDLDSHSLDPVGWDTEAKQDGCYLVELTMQMSSPMASIGLAEKTALFAIQTAEPVLTGYSQPEFPDPSTDDYGPIPGSGLYKEGEIVTLTAPERMTDNSGRLARFSAWHEDYVSVSTDAEYSFICTGSRQLIPVYALTSGGGGGSPIESLEVIDSNSEALEITRGG